MKVDTKGPYAADSLRRTLSSMIEIKRMVDDLSFAGPAMSAREEKRNGFYENHAGHGDSVAVPRLLMQMAEDRRAARAERPLHRCGRWMLSLGRRSWSLGWW